MITKRYKMYAKSHGLSCREMLKTDRKKYPGGCMAGYILWIQEMWRKWAEFVSNNPPVPCILTIKVHGQNIPTGFNYQEHFDNWLKKNI